MNRQRSYMKSQLGIFYPEGHEAHFAPNHPERPERVEAVRQGLMDGGIWARSRIVQAVSPDLEVLAAVHDLRYVRRLEAACQEGRDMDMDTFTTPESWQLALNSAGGALAIAEAVWRREIACGFALCRPPGHHATVGQAMGFCLLNNIAVAAEHLQQHVGAGTLAIIDLDLHHGNGTQDIFWERSDVLYISTHQAPFYPGTGRIEETGDGAGEGMTANFPLPPMTGDDGFLAIMAEGILPVLDRYTPEMLLVSYGFDPHWRDPLGQLQLTADGYGSLIESLRMWADQHCDGRIALFLEGGYDLEAASACGLAAASALVGESWDDPLGPPPYPTNAGWQGVLQRAKEIWGI